MSTNRLQNHSTTVGRMRHTSGTKNREAFCYDAITGKPVSVSQVEKEVAKACNNFWKSRGYAKAPRET